VSDTNNDLEQMRTEIEKLRSLLEKASNRLRDFCSDTNGTMSLVALIESARKLVEEEKKAKTAIRDSCNGQSAEINDLMESRRELRNVLKQLFDRCADADRMTADLDLKGAMPCPRQIDESKPMCTEFERAYGWLISQIVLMLNELRSAKRRLNENEEKLVRSRRVLKEAGDQYRNADDTIRTLTLKLNQLNNKLDETKFVSLTTKKIQIIKKFRISGKSRPRLGSKSMTCKSNSRKNSTVCKKNTTKKRRNGKKS
jgi:chromosome segregation ATPase